VAAATLSRRVVVYGWENVDDSPDFDRLDAATRLHNLEDVDWALDEPDGYVTGVVIDEPGTSTSPTCLRCFRLRSGDDLPHVLNARHEASPLQLEQNEAVTDWTHIVVWPDNFAAHDSRRDAPAMNRLQTYIREQADQRVRFFPLFDRSLIDQLEQLEEIKALDIKFQLPRAEQVAAANQRGMLGGLISVGQQADAVTIQTRVSVGQSRTQFLSQRLRGEVHELAEHAEEFLDNLVITGLRDGATVKIDVLRRRLDYNVRVRRSRALGNAPNPDVMYRAIADARRNLETENRLARAARIAKSPRS
jgi:hypothetical protein